MLTRIWEPAKIKGFWLLMLGFKSRLAHNFKSPVIIKDCGIFLYFQAFSVIIFDSLCLMSKHKNQRKNAENANENANKNANLANREKVKRITGCAHLHLAAFHLPRSPPV